MNRDLYKRFGLAVNLESARDKFINKIQNIITHGAVFDDDTFDLDDLNWEFSNELGLLYSRLGRFEEQYLHPLLSFEEYLFRLQCLINILNRKKRPRQLRVLTTVLRQAIADSPVDLGITIKESNDGIQIHPTGSKFLDKELVDDVLGILNDPVTSPIKIAFEKGLTELLESRRNPLKLKNVVRDMQVAGDELAKYTLKNKDVGLKHLIDRAEEVGLNKYQKQILWNLNEYIDKNVKHKSDTHVPYEDGEQIVYLTGIFIRLIINKRGQ